VVKGPGLTPSNTGYAYREQVARGPAGQTVLGHLAARYTHSPLGEWRARLARGEVSLDGETLREDAPLRPGQTLVWARPPWREADVPLCWALLYRDAHLVAAAKPSGLPTAPAGGFLAHTLLARVRVLFPEATPAHRLGRGTSGLVVFARTSEARAALGRVWREGGVRKFYRARVQGAPPDDTFTIDAPIGPVPHPLLGSVFAAAPGGRPARSHVTVLDRDGDSSLVDVEIETGRPHQIRIHLAWAGFPLLGDPLYGPGGLPRTDAAPALPGAIGYALHAHRLELLHPVTGLPLALSCLPPPGLRLARG
jgi:23S rRNA pseudouridine1911/1915/1917 synthase